MQPIFRCVFGSKLFGVSTPESDTDIKGVHCASFEELVMGQTEPRSGTNGLEGKDKEEWESHHIAGFCKMVRQGQTLVYGMMFCPPTLWLESTPEWEELVENRHRLVSRQILPFVGYARSQASKYSLKGERLKTLQDFVEKLRRMTPSGHEGRLSSGPGGQFDLLLALYRNRPGVRVWEEVLPPASNPPIIRHIEVCGKSFGETTPLKLWIGPLEKLLKKFGKRAMEAKEADGSDLKAMYHGVRLVYEMNEILQTGVVTYPRPEASLLLDIRSGKLTNDEVANLIDTGIAESEELLKTTTLQEHVDAVWLHDWMLRTQRRYV